MTTTKRPTRRTTQGSDPTANRQRQGPACGVSGVPSRALADGVVERRRTPRSRLDQGSAPAAEAFARGDAIPALLSPQEHYRVERERREQRLVGDVATLLAEAKAEYEAHLAAPKPAGKAGRPRKRAPVAKDEFDLDERDALGGTLPGALD